MSSIPLISHRMFVAAVAQERRPAPPDLQPELEPVTEPHTLLEILDPCDWASPPVIQEAQPPVLRGEDF